MNYGWIIVFLALTGCVTGSSIYHECDLATTTSVTRIDRNVLTEQVRRVEATCDKGVASVTVNEATRTDAKGVEAAGKVAGEITAEGAARGVVPSGL